MVLLFILCGGVVFTQVQPAQVNEPLSAASRQWLDEVVPYIISKEERQGFLALTSEAERGRFIEQFWQVRDPDAKTPVNEFKMQYYKRIAMANSYFADEGMPGWKTERGRIFILLGPPMEINRDVSDKNQRQTGAQNGSLEVWNYFGLSSPKLPYNVEIRFIDRLGTGRYELETSNMLRNEGPQQWSFDKISALFNQMEYLADVSQSPYAHLKTPQGQVESAVSLGLGRYLPVKLSFFGGDDKTTYCPLRMTIPLDTLKGKDIAGERFYSLLLQLQVLNEKNLPLKELSREIPLRWKPDSVPKEWTLNSALSLPPGHLHIKGVLYDHYQGRVGEISTQVVVPDFTKPQFMLSDLLMIRSGQVMKLTYELYHLTANDKGEATVTVIYDFLDAKGRVLGKQEIKETTTESEACRLSTEFNLKGFVPGQYQLQVRATDVQSKAMVIKSEDFTIQKTSINPGEK